MTRKPRHFKDLILMAMVFTMAMWLIVSCGGSGTGHKRSAPVSDRSTAYHARHFWDSVDFSDPVLTADTAFMEQNFANYLAALSTVPADSLRPVIAQLIEQAAADTRATDMIAALAAKYLYDYNSPMHDEDMYIAFADVFIASTAIPDIAKTRTEYLRGLSMMNRPGSKANDFEYVLTDGTRHRISEPSDCQTLLLFFDIDCDVCAGVIDDMKASSELKAKIDGGKLRVLVIYVSPDGINNAFGNKVLLNYADRNIPDDWIVGRPVGDIHDIYDLRVLPVRYLLSRHATVILKDI